VAHGGRGRAVARDVGQVPDGFAPPPPLPGPCPHPMMLSIHNAPHKPECSRFFSTTSCLTVSRVRAQAALAVYPRTHCSRHEAHTPSHSPQVPVMRWPGKPEPCSRHLPCHRRRHRYTTHQSPQGAHFHFHFVVHSAGWRLGPYVPTPTHVVARMLKLADVGPADVVYDLGCGDGRVVRAPYTDRLEPYTSHPHLTNSNHTREGSGGARGPFQSCVCATAVREAYGALSGPWGALRALLLSPKFPEQDRSLCRGWSGTHPRRLC